MESQLREALDRGQFVLHYQPKINLASGRLTSAEALIRIDCEPPLPSGLLALGQRADLSLDARHGSELLMFLGRSLAAMIRKWLTIPQA